MGELWGVFWEDLGKNIWRYNGTAIYLINLKNFSFVMQYDILVLGYSKGLKFDSTKTSPRRQLVGLLENTTSLT